MTVTDRAGPARGAAGHAGGGRRRTGSAARESHAHDRRPGAVRLARAAARARRRSRSPASSVPATRRVRAVGVDRQSDAVVRHAPSRPADSQRHRGDGPRGRRRRRAAAARSHRGDRALHAPLAAALRHRQADAEGQHQPVRRGGDAAQRGAAARRPPTTRRSTGLRKRLAAWGVPADAEQIVDGSGLSRHDLIAPEALAVLLKQAHDPAGDVAVRDRRCRSPAWTARSRRG